MYGFMCVWGVVLRLDTRVSEHPPFSSSSFETPNGDTLMRKKDVRKMIMLIIMLISISIYILYIHISLFPPLPLGGIDRPWREALATIYRQSCPMLQFIAPHAIPSKRNRTFSFQAHEDEAVTEKESLVVVVDAFPMKRVEYAPDVVSMERTRMRIGVVSAFFFHHSVGLLLEGVLTAYVQDMIDPLYVSIDVYL